MPPPVQAPLAHRDAATHRPLAQFESATQRHASWAALHTGAGESVVVQVYVAARPLVVTTYP